MLTSTRQNSDHGANFHTIRTISLAISLHISKNIIFFVQFPIITSQLRTKIMEQLLTGNVQSKLEIKLPRGNQVTPG